MFLGMVYAIYGDFPGGWFMALLYPHEAIFRSFLKPSGTPTNPEIHGPIHDTQTSTEGVTLCRCDLKSGT